MHSCLVFFPDDKLMVRKLSQLVRCELRKVESKAGYLEASKLGEP